MASSSEAVRVCCLARRQLDIAGDRTSNLWFTCQPASCYKYSTSFSFKEHIGSDTILYPTKRQLFKVYRLYRHVQRDPSRKQCIVGNNQRPTHAMAPVVLLHDVLAVEHLVADLAGVQLLAVLLLVLGQVAVGGEEARTDVALERFVVCRRGRGGGLKGWRSRYTLIYTRVQARRF